MTRYIYIVGAQCTGKTTLSRALLSEVAARNGALQVGELVETAREILKLHKCTKDDVREGSTRCILLQRMILESQLEREAALASKDIVISDRSGADPLVYATVYGRGQDIDELTSSRAWTVLRANMQRSLVVVCPPVWEWLFDDGVRLVPESWEEWYHVHEEFLLTLKRYEVDFIVVPPSTRSLDDRVRLVLDNWKAFNDA